MQLIPEWKKSLKLWSAQILAFMTVAPIIWAQMPPDMVALIPSGWLPYIVSSVSAAGYIARVIKQAPIGVGK